MFSSNNFTRLFCLSSFFWSVSALAVDGVLEINQACAINGGCFSGDEEGYPITIDGSAGGSYRLTSNLIVPVDTNGVEVNAPSISIDLNGFEIVRSGCEGARSNCTPESGSGSGVSVPNATSYGVSVRNGSITGMGEWGAFLNGQQAEAKGLRVRWNRIDGIHTGVGSTISGNLAYENGADGIFANPGSTISGNTSYSNGSDGIGALSGCLVQRNTLRSNTGYGLNLGLDAAYRENVITDNTIGTVSLGYNLGNNFCNTNDTCP
jgi:hypothetical protein